MAEQTALTLDEKIEFLSRLEIFSLLEDDELAELAGISQQYAFAADSVVIHQRDVADKLYLVESGRLEAVSINDEGVSRRMTQYLPNSYFNDVWLFNPGTHHCSIRARRDGRMLIIKSTDFLTFLGKHRDLLDELELSEEAREELVKSPLAKVERRYKKIKLVPGELVELETKRSRWVFFGKVFPLILGMIGVPLLLYWGLSSAFENMNPLWGLSLSGLSGLLFFLVAVFQWMDWANDYLIITNKRLVHYEFDLRSLSGKGTDTLIDQVQSVETVIPNIYSKILNLGTARVTTAAQSVLYFDYLNSPERVEAAINGIRGRKRSMDEGQFKATMRHSVENYFNISDPLVPLKEEKPVVEKAEPTAVARFISWLTAFRLYRYRVEQGGTITYRKHVFALFVELMWPLGGAIIIAIALLLLSYLELGQFAGYVIVLALIDVLWIIWQTEDWRNDTFQVSDRYVIDIDRRPFGFGESRKQAQLDNIQNVEADRPNFLATIFNFGHVEVETAGADSNIVFESISNPEAIKNDIFKKRSKFQAQIQRGQAERQRKEYAVLLDVFMQERELDRIERRTPDFEALEDMIDSVTQDRE
ncbi:MAG: cyclic nucleotide-binding domain-containing protein [Chloroflexi bacterium]|nr:cyclic nucleotide-binding domain-containing protein [Chloroflexota bacterium]